MSETKTEYDLIGAMLAYENDSLSDEDTIKLFQHIVDNDMLRGLQGHYGRVARQLIKAGKIHARK